MRAASTTIRALVCAGPTVWCGVVWRGVVAWRRPAVMLYQAVAVARVPCVLQCVNTQCLQHVGVLAPGWGSRLGELGVMHLHPGSCCVNAVPTELMLKACRMRQTCCC